MKPSQSTQTVLDLPRTVSSPTVKDDKDAADSTDESDREARRQAEREIPVRRRADKSSRNMIEVDDEQSDIDLPSQPTADAAAQEAPRSSRQHRMPRGGQIDEISFEEDIVESPHSQASQRAGRSRRLKSPSPPSRAVKRTLDTSAASWSPDRRAAQKSGSLVAPAPSSGRQAAANLRTRLAKFASEGVALVPSDDESAPEREGAGEAEEVEESEEAGIDVANGEERGSREIDDSEGDETVGGAGTIDAERQMDQKQKPVGTAAATHTLLDETEGVSEAEDISMDVDTEVRDDGIGSPALMTSEPAEVLQPNGHALTHDKAASPPSLAHRTSSDYRNEIRSANIPGELTMRFDLPRLRRRYAATREGIDQPDTHRPRDAFSTVKEGNITATAGIKNRDAAQAEQALSRVISKPDFGRMEVLGQFNKGFIIARLRTNGDDEMSGKTASDDLFIIDQHASDEKFNFETLQRTTVIKAQSLIKWVWWCVKTNAQTRADGRPRALQLTAGDEIVAMENLEVLKANGFEVTIDEDKPPGRGERVHLAAMPVSKDTTFDFKGKSNPFKRALLARYIIRIADPQTWSSCSTCYQTGQDPKARWSGAQRPGPCLPCALAERA